MLPWCVLCSSHTTSCLGRLSAPFPAAGGGGGGCEGTGGGGANAGDLLPGLVQANSRDCWRRLQPPLAR